jgi:hypothetical protein
MMKGNVHMKTIRVVRPSLRLFLTSVATLALIYSTTTRAEEAAVAAKLNFAGYKEKWRKLESKQIKISDDPASFAKDAGVANYYKTLLKASEGDVKAFAQFNSVDPFVDGASAEWHFGNKWALLHVAGDETFAQLLAGLLAGQSSKVRKEYAANFADPSGTDPISNPKPYIKRYFPKTYSILYGERGKSVTKK